MSEELEIEKVLNDIGVAVDTELEIEIDLNEVVREGMQDKADANFAESFLGIKKEDCPKVESVIPATQPEEKLTKTEVFAEVKSAVLAMDMAISYGGYFIGKMLGKELSIANMSASDAQIKRLSETAQPLYEKYKTQMSIEFLFIFCVLGVYAPKVMGEIASQEIPEKTELEKHLMKDSKRKDDTSYGSEKPAEDWEGDKNYFQTGKKAGTLKPSLK